MIMLHRMSIRGISPCIPLFSAPSPHPIPPASPLHHPVKPSEDGDIPDFAVNDGPRGRGDGGRGDNRRFRRALGVSAGLLSALLLNECDAVDGIFGKRKKKKPPIEDETEPATTDRPKMLLGEGKTMQDAMNAMKNMGRSVIANSHFSVDCHNRPIHIDYAEKPRCERLPSELFRCTGLWKEIFCTRRYRVGPSNLREDRFAISNRHLE